MENQNKIALCIIVKADNREAELLDRCLGGVTKDNITSYHKNINLKKTDGLAKYFDKVFITITGQNKKCEEVAKKYGAEISHREWDFNFSNARNFNFSQVPEDYEYIAWTDSDDIWENPGAIREIIDKACVDKADSIALKYKYDFDEYGNCTVKHLRVRFVKNDGSTKWINEIHEDFQENRKIYTFLNKDIKVIHLTDSKRIAMATARNIYIAEMAVKNNPSDPHSYWNLANTYLLSRRYKDAMSIYLKFIEISNSDEERFISWHRLASTYSATGDPARAIACELEAFALRPWYPDAYFSLGELFYDIGKMKHAVEMINMGLKKEIPEEEAIVWNPLDYTYNPHALLAKVYLAQNKPRESIKELKKCLKLRPKDRRLKDTIEKIQPEIKKFDIAEEIYKKAGKLQGKEEIIELLNEVPEDMTYYPPIVSLRNQYIIKENTTGKDVAIMCSFTEGEWNADVANTTGVGGSEEAVIQLSKRWVKKGYNVVVYCNTPQSQEYEIDGVKWKPFLAWNYRDKWDVTILWRHPRLLDFDINSDKIYLDVHDVLPKEEFNTVRIKKATKIMFKSQCQRDYYPHIPDDKVAVIPHGLDIDDFDEQRFLERDPYRILNTSSPDRGLKTCMKIIKKVHEKLPDNLKPKLKFVQYYGFNVWDADFSNNTRMAEWKNEAIDMMNELKKEGIMTEESGVKIAQDEISGEYLKAGLLLYPSTFFEIGFISGFKAMLGGCIPLTTDIFAQGEFMKGIKIHSEVTTDDWMRDIESGVDYGVENIDEVVDKLVDYLTNVEKYEPMRKEIINYAKTFTWEKTSEEWISLFQK